MAGAHLLARGEGLPRVDSAEGVHVVGTDGRRYLDAAGGAVVVGVGHGRTAVVEAAAEQARRVAYVHGTAFCADVLDEYADALAARLPVADARVYPVSGGSEAVETALKMARAHHLARGEDRSVVVGRRHSYHGSTRGALDVSGRVGLRAPYEPWLSHAVHTSTPQEYRCPNPDHPVRCGRWHAHHLERTLAEVGPERVAAFVAEPVAGAGLAACVPPGDYWPAVVEVCRRHGVLVVADEVMTGFGRTGRWFASEHYGLQPDLLTAGKGAASGYWPLGLAVASGEVAETLREGGFVHGFTYSHHLVGAATGLAVLRCLEEDGLVAAAQVRGRQLRTALEGELADSPLVGDVRGAGLLVGVELVADRASRRPFPRSERLTERLVATAKELGLLLYPAAGCADGTSGDAVLLGPPLVISASEVDELVTLLSRALRALTPGTAS
ncbi:aspartate aminotransferase family protein [Desertihabitans brevis]|uniref:Aspartate aminotransferase family protein n=1 Tax=Desertihabitans brevis TaxID=2268447 RepID=A0A367YRM2_9ACTN|nr:aminotransferase class III-fold pyridoxal phosphate-dependent enzyme [Desertihabitans brevis]RCK68199.1 aspartate aminotransferase family protein [Desertihabitans brevis]